jgi:hypothetical protein
MSQEDHILNPKNIRITGVEGYVTYFGAQDAASGDPAQTSWLVTVNDIGLASRNRDYAEIFLMAIQKRLKVSVGYTDGKDVFIARIIVP